MVRKGTILRVNRSRGWYVVEQPGYIEVEEGDTHVVLEGHNRPGQTLYTVKHLKTGKTARGCPADNFEEIEHG